MILFDQIDSAQVRKLKLIVSDFDGVFTDNYVYTSDSGVEYVRCSKYDSMGLKKLYVFNLSFIVVSSETNKSIIERCKKLSIECHTGIINKGIFLKEHIEKNNLSPDQVLYIGNDINDLPALQFATIRVAVADSHFDYKSRCNFITKASGGHGCIREICDVIERKIYEKSS